MRKTKPRDTFGIFIIALNELLLGFVGVCILTSALATLSGLALPNDLVTELISNRLYKSGINVEFSLAWAIIYVGLLPIGVGMLVRKEWARAATRRILPPCLLLSFPLFFPSFQTVIDKLHIQYSLAKAIHLEHDFWPYFFRDTEPWFVFAVSVVALTFLLRNYLKEPPIKALFK